MKYLPLIWAALFRSRLRTLLTFLSIVVAFLLFGVLHGVIGGLDVLIDSMSDTRLRTLNRIGFTHWMPIAMRDQIARIPGVTAVAANGYFGGYYQDPKNQLGGSAMDMAALFKIYPELVLPADERAAMLRTRTGALIGADLATRYGWKVGDHVTVDTPIWAHPDGSHSWGFDIVGIFHYGQGDLPTNELWMNYDYFSEGGGMKDQASVFIVGVKDAASATRVSRQIDAYFRSSASPTLTQTEKQWAQSNIRRTGNIRFIVNAIIGAVLFTLLALTANTMMQSVRMRTGEFAVLRTFGYSNRIVATLVVLEALLLCVGGALCGLALAALAFPPLMQGIGLAPIPIPVTVVGAGFAIAVGLALVSAVPPVWRASRLDVAAALAAH
ncbi:MAG TPA: FtsX-like permease family protein [Steroidobacteraceae bacterium]|jgi:putative ABC transport system permease protein|nr:FtsX-like permease family protein [Steroidobacteraceae bacterium]